MEKKQSSIDWLEDKLNGVDTGVSHHYFNSIIQEAKVMHKQEIVDAYEDGHLMGSSNLENTGKQHYHETYGNG